MYKEAKQIFTESIVLAKSLAPRHMAKSRMYLAAVQYGLGEIDSALILIHNIPQEVDTIDKVSAMAYAAQIYQDAGMPDSAYIYAIGVLNDSSKLHHEIAYSVLLSPELQPVVV